jgi:hypothetical protein
MKAKKKTKRIARSASTGRFIVGRDAFARFSEVEGIIDTEESRQMFAEFDRLGLSPAQRRKAIMQKYRKAQAR